jgi:hypothetical protein
MHSMLDDEQPHSRILQFTVDHFESHISEKQRAKHYCKICVFLSAGGVVRRRSRRACPERSRGDRYSYNALTWPLPTKYRDVFQGVGLQLPQPPAILLAWPTRIHLPNKTQEFLLPVVSSGG